jgi:antitoxin (DNA-binding transcriptional repressor) of toxin-antitoxin stability system
MKTVTIEEFRARLDECLADAASRDVILTNEGKPWLVLHAIGSPKEQDSTAFTASSEFWRMIHERRREQGIPWEEARKELDQDETGD